MRREGIIFLYDRTGEEVVAAKKYDFPGERKTIIESWEKMYAGLFQKCYIQIAPVVIIEMIGDRGENIKYPPRKTDKEEVEKPPLIRPKSEYTNLKVYKYK